MTAFPPPQYPEPVMIPANVVVPKTGRFGRIYDTCVNTLTVIGAIFAAADIPLPTQQLVSNGPVAYDGGDNEPVRGLLAVEAQRLRPGAPGIPSLLPVQANTPYSLEMLVHLLRPVPMTSDQGFPPTSEETQESAQELLADWWTLYEGILLGRARGSTGDPGELQGAPFRKVMLNEIILYAPSGGFGGLVATLTSELV